MTQSEPRFCYKCHFPASVSDAKCPRCGGVLRTKATIRVLGAVLVFLGGFIALLMAVVMLFVLGILAQADASKIKGDEDKMLFALGIIGLTFSVGAAFAIAGVWQIVFGRRNTIIVWISLILVGVLLIAGRIFMWMS